MKIRLGNLELARGLAQGESPLRFSLATTRETQAAAGLRADAVEVFDRGNTRTTLSFAVSKRHDSAEAALRFAAAHPAALGAETGGLVFLVEDGAGEAELCLPDAALRSVRCVPAGRVTETDYEFTGTAIVRRAN